MNMVFRLFAVMCLVAFPFAHLRSADLSKIERVIAKEPKYNSTPKYCLLVFGPKVTTRVWVVLDGETLIVDRNGSGDLSEDGKQVRCSKVERTPSAADDAYREIHHFGPIDIRDRGNGALYSHLKFEIFVLNPGFTGNKDLLDVRTGEVPFHVGVRIGGDAGQTSGSFMALRPQDAPIVHFDGPTELGVSPETRLIRGTDKSEVYATLGTPGLGKLAFASWDFTRVPKGVHPRADIVFPGRSHAPMPIMASFTLTSRC